MDDTPSSPPSLTSMRRTGRILKAGYGVVAVAMLAWAVWVTWGDSGKSILIVSWSAQLQFIACWAGMAALLGYAWARVLHAHTGICLSLREWLPVQGVAWAGRYLPGKIGLLAGKMTLLATKPLTLKLLTFSVLYEQVAFLLTGFMVVVLLFPAENFGLAEFAAMSHTWLLASRVVVAVAVCLGTLIVLNHIAARMQAVSRPSASTSAVLVLLYLVAHLLAGAGLFCMLAAMPLAADAPGFLYLMALLAAANIAGILAVFAPAGVGVREGVLAAGLTQCMSWTDALAFAALLRVLTLVADAVFVMVAGGLPLLARHRNQP